MPLHTQDHLAAQSEPPPQNPHHATLSVQHEPQSLSATLAGLQSGAESQDLQDEVKGSSEDTGPVQTVPWLSDCSRASVMQLIWANFEVGQCRALHAK